jgi:hypothetical protein
MFFVKSDFNDGDGAYATFSARLKSAGNGKILVQVYATGGCVAGTPYIVRYGYTTESAGALWLQAHAFATNPAVGLIGVASDAISAGSLGWVQVRGPIGSVSFGVASQTGSIGHAVFWGSSNGLKATSSTYIGAVHQVGILTSSCTGGTNSASLLLLGNAYAQSV